MPHKPPAIYLKLLLVGLIWGSSFTAIKIILTEVTPITLVLGRTGMASGILLILLLSSTETRIKMKLPLKDCFHLSIAAVMSITLPFMLISWGEKGINSGLASILNAGMPLFTIILAKYFIKNSINRQQVEGVVTGFIGILLLLDFSFSSIMKSDLIHQAAVLGAAFFYAAGAVYTKIHLNHLSSRVISFYTLTATTIYTTILAFIFEDPLSLSISFPVFATWFYLSAVASVLAMVLFYSILRQTSPAVVSMVTYLIPVSGVILGIVLLGEQISLKIISGMLLIFAGIFLTGRKPAL